MEMFRSISKAVATFLNKYKHGYLTLYFIFYIIVFSWLEQNITGRYQEYHVIHMAIDDYIPFVEIFVVPYLLWFFYVGAGMIYFGIVNAGEFKKLCYFLFTGMTIFLLVSLIYPNGHQLRLHSFPRENVFTDLVAWLWTQDTATNLFPSIHVYNSIGVCIAIYASATELCKKSWVRASALVLTISIVLSTVLIKQHSVFDVITAFGLAAVVHALVYGRKLEDAESPIEDLV